LSLTLTRPGCTLSFPGCHARLRYGPPGETVAALPRGSLAGGKSRAVAPVTKPGMRAEGARLPWNHEVHLKRACATGGKPQTLDLPGVYSREKRESEEKAFHGHGHVLVQVVPMQHQPAYFARPEV
jgi:hypothetical protein